MKRRAAFQSPDRRRGAPAKPGARSVSRVRTAQDERRQNRYVVDAQGEMK